MAHVKLASLVLTAGVAVTLAGCASVGGPAGEDAAAVAVNCAIQPDGTLTDCRVVSETPPDAGFGEAALEAASTARLGSDAVRSAAASGRVRFIMRFRLVDGEPVSDLAGPEAQP